MRLFFIRSVFGSLFFLLMAGMPLRAQQYTGMSGLIQVPSADMDAAGEARIGGHFLNREFLPPALHKGGVSTTYAHTGSYYVSLTPFSWIQASYHCTLLRNPRVRQGQIDYNDIGYYQKDRAFAVKLQPIREREGKWWPSVAVGVDDPASILKGSDVQMGNKHPNPETQSRSEDSAQPQPDKTPLSSGVKGSRYFANWYVAASKHLDWRGNRLGMHVAYRNWQNAYNTKFDGVVGGLTFQPSFQRNLRFIAEYTGDDVNVGFDWKLWKHLLVQSSLQNGKYFSGGLCFCINLL